MKFRGEGILTFSTCNTHNGYSFQIPEFEPKENQSWTEFEVAFRKGIDSFLRQMRTATKTIRKDKKDIKVKMFDGVMPEEISIRLYEEKPKQPESVPVLEGQGKLF